MLYESVGVGEGGLAAGLGEGVTLLPGVHNSEAGGLLPTALLNGSDSEGTKTEVREERKREEAECNV